MERRTFGWHSPALDRTMEVARFGDYGKPVVLFPTAGGDFLECERFKLLYVLEPLITAQRIKVYTCGSISGEGWLSPDAAPHHKSWLQSRFDEYLVRELLPFIKHDSGDTDQRFVATGASIGAYNAFNAGAKHPEWFDLVIAMSGTYFFDRWMEGYRDQNYYFNMPVQFVPNIGEGPQLEQLRKSFFLLATGQGRAEAPWESVEAGRILGAQGIPNRVEVWGEDVPHDWPTWRTMLPLFLDKLVR